MTLVLQKDDEDLTLETPTTVGRGRGRKSSLAINSTPDSDKKKSHKRGTDDNLKKRLKTLFSTVYDYSVRVAL